MSDLLWDFMSSLFQVFCDGRTLLQGLMEENLSTLYRFHAKQEASVHLYWNCIIIWFSYTYHFTLIEMIYLLSRTWTLIGLADRRLKLQACFPAFWESYKRLYSRCLSPLEPDRNSWLGVSWGPDRGRTSYASLEGNV